MSNPKVSRIFIPIEKAPRLSRPEDLPRVKTLKDTPHIQEVKPRLIPRNCGPIRLESNDVQSSGIMKGSKHFTEKFIKSKKI